MGQIIKDIKLEYMSEERTIVRFKLKDGSKICLPEKRLLEKLGYEFEPLEWMVISVESLKRYKKALTDQRIFHYYLMLEAHNHGLAKTVIKKNGDAMFLGHPDKLKWFKTCIIERRDKD